MKGSEYVVHFDCGRPDAARLGGKGASLCRLVSQGHLVPPGFVVTVDAFYATCRHVGLSDALEKLIASVTRTSPDEASGEILRRGFASGSLPHDVRKAIADSVEILRLWNNNTVGLIARSSATSEDGAAHSFAGIFESLQVVNPESLESKVLEVWSSVFSPRALSYVRFVNLNRLPAMGVVVQRFLEASRSGVMFTTYPQRERRTLIEHVDGGCEKLVKGEVTPEKLWLKDRQHAAAIESSLKPAHIQELARLAGTLEAEFDGPQDVEWVIYEDRVHLVQSRPITTTLPDVADAGRLPSVGGMPPMLTGTPASPGIGSGETHLVFNIEQALRLRRGQVLVTPMTNPDMVVAMRNAAAIVTDVGGMICHAAIVSRELDLPCVVGTEIASQTCRQGDMVTVDGGRGVVYSGEVNIRVESSRALDWGDLWSIWSESVGPTRGFVPIIPSVNGLSGVPANVRFAALTPDFDLRSDPHGLWFDLEALTESELSARLDAYFQHAARLAKNERLESLYVLVENRDLASAVNKSVNRAGAPLRILTDPSEVPARPVAAAALAEGSNGTGILGGIDAAKEAAYDTMRFFGHRPDQRITTMPLVSRRRRWWTMLPEYGRYHGEFATDQETGEFAWLEVRPEVVISTLLKSLVQPGFEMIPRVLRFSKLPPLYTKWIKCRYYFRADTFAKVWRALVDATWDTRYMADLMRRVRASYEHLAEVLILFPATDEELARIEPGQIAALISSWWPRWVEFFALCWFIQAQGDDILYPFIEETVNDNLKRLSSPPVCVRWPTSVALVAPTTPVLSGAYVADVGTLRQLLDSAGLGTTKAAMSAMERGEVSEIARQIEAHLAKWHWMRDRDLLFEPWDTPERVVATALKTEPHTPVDYEANLKRNLLALGFHAALAQTAQRFEGMNHAVRFLHDLNVERENHHVLWLKYSYPLRRLFLEIERRLIEIGSLSSGDVFFLEAPELIEAARNLPAKLDDDLVARIKNRRQGYLHEARLERNADVAIAEEDDYY